MIGRNSAYRRGSDTVSPEVVDRMLIGACAVVWLIWLGVSVAAVVALVDLGRGFHKMSSNPHTTWVLYAVIVISALIIAGAIPVLLRARRLAQGESAAQAMTAPARGPESRTRPLARLGSPGARGGVERAPQSNLRAAAPEADWSGEAVDRIWLRGMVSLAGTIGAALIAVAAATYLMAVGHDGPSWAGYALAGLVTAAMPVVEWLHIRQLRRVVAEH